MQDHSLEILSYLRRRRKMTHFQSAPHHTAQCRMKLLQFFLYVFVCVCLYTHIPGMYVEVTAQFAGLLPLWGISGVEPCGKSLYPLRRLVNYEVLLICLSVYLCIYLCMDVCIMYVSIHLSTYLSPHMLTYINPRA